MYINTSGRPGNLTPGIEPRLVDNRDLPEIVVTGVSGMANLGGIIALTLECGRADHSRAAPEIERHVVGRIAMTVPTAQMMIAALAHFLDQLGYPPMPSAGPQTTFQ